MPFRPTNSYSTVPVGPSLKTPTSSTLPGVDEADDGGKKEKEAGGEGEIGDDSTTGGVSAALTAQLKQLEMQPSILSLSGGTMDDSLPGRGEGRG